MISAWQIWFNEQSFASLDNGFIPYDNRNKATVFFENEVIIDIYKNQRHLWVKSEYTGVLSWQFHKKAGLNSSDIFASIYRDKERGEQKDVYLLTPKSYMGMVSVVHDSSFGQIVAVRDILNKSGVLPFELTGNNNGVKSFCNFWMVKPEVFNDYVGNYLIPLYRWMKFTNNTTLIELLHQVTPHKRCTPHTFIMEGLFQYYIAYKGWSFGYIHNEKTALKGYAFGREFTLS